MGYYYDKSKKTCNACAKGKYKGRGNGTSCTGCPACTTTEDKGSTSKKMCTVSRMNTKACTKDADCPGSQSCFTDSKNCKKYCGCKSGYSYNKSSKKCEKSEHTCVYSAPGVCGACGHASGTRFGFKIESMSRHSTNVKQGLNFSCSGVGTNVGKVVGTGCCNIYWTERY